MPTINKNNAWANNVYVIRADTRIKERLWIKMTKIQKAIISLLIITAFVMTSDYNVEASEQQSVVDLTNLTNDEIAKALDQSPKTQDFIILNSKQLKQLKGYNVEAVVAKEDFGNVNSTMWGIYDVYKVNGHYVFCIEPGYDTLNTSNKTEESGSIYSKFSSESKAYISRVISSSIDNYQQTNKNDYIFAGQLLLWDYLSAHEGDVIGNPMASWNPEYLNSWTINKSVYYPQIKIIEEELAQWSVLPSFLGSSKAKAKGYTLKYDKTTGEFSTILTDTNKVWDQKFANYSQVGNYKLSNPSGSNNVKISTTKEQTTYISPHRYQWTPTISDKKEFYDAGQDLIYIGAVPVNGYIKFKTAAYPKGGFQLTKVGEQINGEPVPLKNVKFKVIGSSFEKTYVTDENGNINVASELVPGNYHVEEMSVSSQYVANFQQDFTVKPGEVTKLNGGKQIENKLYYNLITFKKVGADFVNGSTTINPLAGVQFELYKEGNEPNNIIDGDDQLIAKLQSDQDGLVTSDKLYVGDYIIKEVATNEGYVMSEQPYSFKVENTGEIVSGTKIDLGIVSNEVIQGQVEFLKIGVGSCPQLKDCSKPLGDVQFAIYPDLNENGIIDDNEASPISQVTTDVDGKGISAPLKYGSYILKEIDSPHLNYEITETVYPFTITDENMIVQVNDGNPLQNNEKTGSIEITKTGQTLSSKNQDRIALADATYQIKDTDGKIVSELTTDEQGTAQSGDLSFGTYQIQEIAAPNGYVLDSSSYQFEINEDTYAKPIKLKFSDDVIKNKIEISKIDKADKSLLTGAELVIIDQKTDEEIDRWTSSAKPYKVELNYGNYKICEKTAPDGYKQTAKCQKFDVTENNLSQKLQIENTKMKIFISGQSGKTIWLIGSLILLGINTSILRMVISRRKKGA